MTLIRVKRERRTLTAALQDWNSRSQAAGVVQAIRFGGSDANVTAYKHSTGNPDRVQWEPADGVVGDGCLHFEVDSTDAESSGNWRAPLNSSWVTDQQGFGSTRWYVQFRFKAGTDRLLETNGGGFKVVNFAEFRPQAPNSSRSHPDNEIVIGNGFGSGQGIVYAYREHPVSGTTPFEVDLGGDIGLVLQPAVNHGTQPDDPLLNKQYCRYNGGNASEGCIDFVEGVWMTIYMIARIADYGGAGTGNEIDIYVAFPGDTDWRHLYDNRNFRIGSDSALPNGINGVWFLPFDTGRTGAAFDTWQRYDQLIVSTQPIAVPLV